MKQFTRDEAIAIAKHGNYEACKKLHEKYDPEAVKAGVAAGIRLTLEALAAKGVFLHGEEPEETMADRLDAAGIR